MRAMTTILALLFATGCAVAQDATSSSGPFSRYEAQRLSEVWSEVRQAEEYEDIDWQATGLEREPGDAQARRIMAANWDSIREAADFRDIDWEATAGYDESSQSRFEDEGRLGDDEDRFGRRDRSSGPFTEREAELLSAVWSDIREAESFREIDWQAAGLDFAPGDADARRIMAENWDTLRQAAEFDDIDWEATTRYGASDRFGDDDDGLFGRRDETSFSGPFTRREAELMSEAWPEVREAAAFEQIDWQAAGLDFAPGDADARRIMAENWDTLRQAAEFEDIDWEATTDYGRR